MDVMGRVWGAGRGASTPSPAHHAPRTWCLHTWKPSESGAFMELSLVPASPWRRGLGELSVPTPQSLGLPGDQPLSRGHLVASPSATH